MRPYGSCGNDVTNLRQISVMCKRLSLLNFCANYVCRGEINETMLTGNRRYLNCCVGSSLGLMLMWITETGCVFLWSSNEM